CSRMTSRGPLGPRRQGSVKSSLGGSGYRKDESGGRTRRRGSFTVPASSGSGRASSSCLRGMPSNWRAACVAWEFTWPSGPCPSRGRPWRSSVVGLRSRLNMLTIGPRTLEIAALGCLRVVRTYAEGGVSQDEKAAHIAALVAALRYRRKALGKPLREIALAGTCFGAVLKTKIIDGRAIRPGDVIVGLPSTGIHSNGLTLARRVLADSALTIFDALPEGGRPWGEELLEPTAIYVRPVLRALGRAKAHGMAHITGGGVRNLVRLKSNVEFRISEPLEVPAVFRALQMLGGIAPSEMYQTFNMGMGFAIVAPEDAAKPIIRSLRPEVNARVVGSVER